LRNFYFHSNKKRIEFKSSDNFSLKLLNESYLKISDYLNDKYLTILNKNNSKTIKKKIIKVFIVDSFSFNYHVEWLKSKLKDNFIIKIDSKNPDYLFFNVFGKEHLQKKYNNAIKIAIYSENKIPDLNYSDYSIGHSHISYLDKYYKYPTGIILSYNEKIRKIRELVLKSSIRKKFCGAVISNSLPFSNFRLLFIKELTKYKKVDMGGKYNNNVGGMIQNKINFLSSYKFSIAMENSEGDGYLTEKIFQSFLSGTIPIY
jgi:hypothetical protein